MTNTCSLCDQPLAEHTASYDYTTIEYATPRIWAHERDWRDYRDGREDGGPLTDPVTTAIAEQYAQAEELLGARIHTSLHCPPRVSFADDITITIGGTTGGP